MFHHVFYSAISIVVNLAFAILPPAPLLAVKRIPASSTKNIWVQDQARVGSFGQQPAKFAMESMRLQGRQGQKATPPNVTELK
jgi:hypothetical protein